MGGGNLCVVSGLIKATRGMRNPITRLPPNCRPNKRLIFNLNNHENTLRVDVLPNGQIHKVAGIFRHGWLSLDGIVFAVRDRVGLTLENRWKSGSVSYTRSGSLC